MRHPLPDIPENVHRFRRRVSRGQRACPGQQQSARSHTAVGAIGERGNSLLKTTFETLRKVSLRPWCIGRITAASLAILHIDHRRTT